MSHKKVRVDLTGKQTKEVILSLKASAQFRSTNKQRVYLEKLIKSLQEQTRNADGARA